jgi:hypothetical protein
MLESLPQSVRYVKNGSGGRWWEAAKARGQVHCGWWFVPRDLLHRLDLPQIKDRIQDHYKKPGKATADFNAFKKLVVENPSRHVWITCRWEAFGDIKSSWHRWGCSWISRDDMRAERIT